MNIEIKSLPEDRWEDSKFIRLEALKKESSAFGSSYEEEIKFTEDIWKSRIKNGIFALVDDKPVGLTSYIVSSRIKQKHKAEIHAVYVDKEFRGKGIGKMLIQKALDEIKKSPGIKKVELGVMSQQDAAIALYEHFGFKKVGLYSKASFVDGQFYDAVMMELLF